MLMSDQGHLVRIEVSEVNEIGRNTQGVRLISLSEDQRLVGVVRIEDENGKAGSSEMADDGVHDDLHMDDASEEMAGEDE